MGEQYSEREDLGNRFRDEVGGRERVGELDGLELGRSTGGGAERAELTTMSGQEP